MKHLIYSIEDDQEISNIINLTLKKVGYEVKSFLCAEDFFVIFEKKKPDLILLDMKLPQMQGDEVLKIVRSDSSNDDINIVIISANSMISDKVAGLDLGADDYISKPFDILELISRVNAKLRKKTSKEIVNFTSDIVVDFANHKIIKENVEVLLTAKECEVLKILYANRGDLVSREDLISKVWGIDTALETRAIDVHVASLRKKLGKSQNILESVYGTGYRLNV